MRAIPVKTLREIRDALQVCASSHNGEADSLHALQMQKLASAVDYAIEPRRSFYMARKRIEDRAALRRALVQKIRDEVMARAGQECEACTLAALPAQLEMDHFFGGSRRRAEERVETCWALCPGCHRMKTDNFPDSQHWAHVFAEHCERHGYTREAELARARLP